MDVGRIPAYLPEPLWGRSANGPTKDTKVKSGTNLTPTISYSRYKPVNRHRSVEHHFGTHRLLSHKVAVKEDMVGLDECCHKNVASESQAAERDSTNLSTRASDVKPAMAIPTWSSIRNIFCWYDANSPVDRCDCIVQDR